MYRILFIALFLAPAPLSASIPDVDRLSSLRRGLRPIFTSPQAKRAIKAQEEGRNTDCARGFERMYRTGPNLLTRRTALYRAALCYEKAKAWDKAERAYREISSWKASLEPLAELRRSVVLNKLKRRDEALRALDTAVQDPALAQRARRYRVEVDLLKSGASRVHAYASSKDHATRMRVATVYEEQGQVNKAREHYLFVWLRSPRSPNGKVARAKLEALWPKCFQQKGFALPCLDSSMKMLLAEDLFRTHASKDVIKLVEPLLKDPAFRATKKWCDAAYLVARSYDKLRDRDPAQPWYGAAFSRCKKHDDEPGLLFFGGISAFREGHHAQALKLLTALHKRWPKHSFNDDAVLYEAAVFQEQKKLSASEARLWKGIQDYPSGDMIHEMAWRYVHSALKRGHRKTALTRIKKLKGLVPKAADYQSRGRLEYWEGRLLERRGQRRRAERVYRRIMREEKLSYHALLAYLRLSKRRGKKRAKRWLFDAIRTPLARPKPAKGKPVEVNLENKRALQRIVLLVRMGLEVEAKRELEKLPRDEQADQLLQLAFFSVNAGLEPLTVYIMRRMMSEFDQLPVKGAAKAVWRLAYPIPFESEVKDHSKAKRVDPFLVWSIMREESSFNPKIESWANAVGLMQLMPPTARNMAKRGSRVTVSPQSLRDPDTNIRLGVRYLHYLQERFDHPALMIAGYNAGDHRIRTWLKKNGRLPLDEFVASIPYRQTRGYTMRVLESLFRYHVLYSKSAPRVSVKVPKEKKVSRATKKAKRRRKSSSKRRRPTR